MLRVKFPVHDAKKTKQKNPRFLGNLPSFVKCSSPQLLRANNIAPGEAITRLIAGAGTSGVSH